MAPDPRAELRALALWHSRRRAVDELLTSLLAIGPIAVDRVARRLPEVRELMDEEQRAFDGFVALLLENQQPDAVVLDLFGRREPTEG